MKKDYLIIDRAKWRTGGNVPNTNSTGEGNTFLLNDEGFMCCLGFRCHQMGIPKNDLLGASTPGSLSNGYTIPDLIEEKSWGWVDSEFTSKAIEFNDSRFLTPEQREKAITEHFKKIGVTVEFKGRYKKSKV